MNQEQLEGTEAKVPCIVTGLTKTLDDVKWEKPDGTLITSGNNNFVIDKGSLEANSQTTILTVPAAANTQDTTFNCVISSREHRKTDDSTSVTLKVFSKYSCSRSSKYFNHQFFHFTMGFIAFNVDKFLQFV